MNAQLMHYARESFTLDRTRGYGQSETHAFGKPTGFWVSVAGDGDWPSWCRAEEFDVDRLAVEHAVVLAPDANVLRIESANDLDNFHARYAVETEYERRYPTHWRQSWPIDWRVVAEHCDGVVIAPYQWSHRLNLDWYCGWDVASGCIWNLDAIASLTVMSAVSA